MFSGKNWPLLELFYNFAMNEPFPKCFHGKIIKEVQKGDAKGVRVETLESMTV